MELPESLRSFRHRNFALFFFGQFISRIGMWMQRTAVIWVVYSTTHNAFMIGVVSFAEQFPSFLFSVSGGIIAEKAFKVLFLASIVSLNNQPVTFRSAKSIIVVRYTQPSNARI